MVYINDSVLLSLKMFVFFSIRIENQTSTEEPMRHLHLKTLCYFHAVLFPKVLFIRKVFFKVS